MAQRDCAAIHIHFLDIEAESLDHRQRLCGKSFIQFNHVNLIQCETSELQRFRNREHRPDAHLFWWTPRRRISDESCQGLCSQFLCAIFRHYYGDGRAI